MSFSIIFDAATVIGSTENELAGENQVDVPPTSVLIKDMTPNTRTNYGRLTDVRSYEAEKRSAWNLFLFAKWKTGIVGLAETNPA